MSTSYLDKPRTSAKGTMAEELQAGMGNKFALTLRQTLYEPDPARDSKRIIRAVHQCVQRDRK